jgi:hypothetical protein
MVMIWVVVVDEGCGVVLGLRLDSGVVSLDGGDGERGEEREGTLRALTLRFACEED